MIQILDVKVGDEFKHEQKIDKYQTMVYAGATGDFTPIHIDNEVAKSFGYGAMLVHGQCIMAHVSRVVVDWLGDPGRLKKLCVNYTNYLYPGDTLKIKGKVVKIEGNKITCDLTAENQNGVKIVERSYSVAIL